MENTFALYNKKTNEIENIIALDPEIVDSLPDFPPEGYGVVHMPEVIQGENSVCGIGWHYIDKTFVEPKKPE